MLDFEQQKTSTLPLGELRRFFFWHFNYLRCISEYDLKLSWYFFKPVILTSKGDVIAWYVWLCLHMCLQQFSYQYEKSIAEFLMFFYLSSLHTKDLISLTFLCISHNLCTSEYRRPEYTEIMWKCDKYQCNKIYLKLANQTANVYRGEPFYTKLEKK